MEVKIIEITSIAMLFISFYGLITSDSIVKSVVAISLMETAVVMFFLGIGFNSGAIPPIGKEFSNVADPFPQALVITAIVIGVAVTAINLTMFISLYRKYNTSNWEVAKKESRD